MPGAQLRRLPLRLPRRNAALCAAAAAALCLPIAAGPCAAQVTLEQPAERGAPPARGKGGIAVDTPAAAGAATPTAAEGPGADAPLLEEINRWRAAGATCGGTAMPPAAPMRWNALLHRAAEAHVRDMAPRNGGSIGHRGSDGSTAGVRARAAGYAWTTVGENVAAGRATASATLAQWMASAGHCSNIMNPAFADVAVAGLHLPGTTYAHYWVMVLGRP